MFCPTYAVDGVPQIQPETAACMNGMTHPDGVEVETMIGMDNPYPDGGHRNTLHQYCKARTDALTGGYDALLTIEHDMIVPPDALTKLWDTDAQVVYGLYAFRHRWYVINAMQYTGAPTVGDSLSGKPREMEAAEKRGWAEVSGIGFGCTLLRREALEQFDFHASGENYSPDRGFAQDCVRAGVKQIARFDVKCGHIDAENGRVLWPGKGVTHTVKCKILVNFIGSIPGRGSVRFTAGETVDLPDYEAGEYARAAFLEILDKPAIKIVNKPAAGKAVK